MSKIVITRNDVLWGYIAQGCNIGANILVLPAIFRFLPTETLGVWYIFVNLGMFSTLIGVVFQNAFARNLSYAFGGATSLLKDGIDKSASVLDTPNYPLIKSLIKSMNKFYSYVSVGMAILLLSFGIVYIYYLTRSFSNQMPIIIAWALYALSVVGGFYCIIFTSLLSGRGYVREHNQLLISNRMVYMLLAYIFLLKGYGLMGIVYANCISVFVNYFFGQYLAYKDGLTEILNKTPLSSISTMRVVWHNTYRQGIASLAMYISTKGSLFYASLFISLDLVAQYGISLQVINVLTTISLLYYGSYTPYIAQGFVEQDYTNIRRIYSKSLVLMLVIYLLGSASTLVFGDWGLNLIGSGTTLLSTLPLFMLFVVYLLDSNQSIALGLISSGNKVPYLKSSLISALAIFILMPIFAKVFGWGIYGVILSIGLVQLCYQNWRWIVEVSSFLGINYWHQIKLGFSYWCKKDRIEV